MKFFILLATSLLVVTQASANNRDTMQGATQSEREIRWVWKHLHGIASSCLQSQDCKDPKVNAAVTQLVSYLPLFSSAEAKQWASLLKFVPESQGGFQSNQGETHRVVMTGLTKFSPVYVNTDRMDLSLEMLVGLFAHEATHHLGYDDGADRLPDLVGAALAKHFKTNLQYSSLEQFKLPKTRFVLFNSSANEETLSFISWSGGTVDVGWDSNEVQPFCGPGETLFKEFISAPAWKVNAFAPAKAVVKVRGGGVIQITCANKMTGVQRRQMLPLDASMDLQYKKPFNRLTWQQEVPTELFQGMMFSPSYNPFDHVFGAGGTFAVISQTFDKASVTAGETLHATIVLQNLETTFTPDRCELTLAGMQYAYKTMDHLPGVQMFESCVLTSLGNNKWQVEGNIHIPSTARPDLYYIPLIKVSKAFGDRVAIPLVPKMIEVTNLSAAAVPTVSNLRIKGLSPASALGTLTDLTNSYLAPAGSMFTVEFDVFGTQTLDDLWLDLQIWFPGQTEFKIANGTGSSVSLPQVLIKTQITKLSDRTTIAMTYRMPSAIQGIQVSAIKFVRFYIRSSDFSWAEIEMPGFHEAMVVSPQWGH